MELCVGCDFADIFEVRGWRRDARGDFVAPAWTDRELAFGYVGRDGRLIRSAVRFADPPERVTSGSVRWRFTLERQVPRRLEWEVVASDESRVKGARQRELAPVPRHSPLDDARAELEERYRAWRRECSRWLTDVPKFDVTLRRAVDDLRALWRICWRFPGARCRCGSSWADARVGSLMSR